MAPHAVTLPLLQPPTIMTDSDADTPTVDRKPSSQQQPTRPTRPENPRSSTDPSPSPSPSPSLLIQGYFKDKDNLKDWARPSSSHRNRSPYSRSHLRSRSSGAVAGLPLMTRAHSMPSPYTPRPFADSPATTPARTRSPFFLQADEGAGIESIQEDSELDLRPRSSSQQGQTPVQPTALRTVRVSSGSGRRRPASPFSQPPPTSSPATLDQSGATTSSASSSPSLPPLREARYNEAFPAPLPHQTLHHHSSTSSMTSFSSLNSVTSYPSTPTSARSRSPSISSLDTIEDDPEMELKEEEEEGEEEGGGRRGSFDGGGGSRVGVGFGFTRGRSERKRWSVCGGERRGDLDLETIWED